jgi:all-trans-retinol 13,14-reductase
VGLHYVGGMAAREMGRQLFDFVTRGGVRWQKMPSPFEKFVYPDFTFDEPDDETSYRQAFIARYPQERDAIETYFRDLHAVAGWYGAQIVAQVVPRGPGCAHSSRQPPAEGARAVHDGGVSRRARA